VKQQSKAITRKLHKKIASAKKLSAKLLAACNKREQGMKEAEAQYAAVVRRFNQNQLQKTSGAAAADMAVAMAKQNTVKLQLVKKSMETSRRNLVAAEKSVANAEAAEKRATLEENEHVSEKMMKEVVSKEENVCATKRTCGGCLAVSSDVKRSIDCGWCNGRCYDSDANGPLVGDVCVDKFLFGDAAQCGAGKSVATEGHDAPIPETLGGEEDVAKATKVVAAKIKKITQGFLEPFEKQRAAINGNNKLNVDHVDAKKGK
jgi:hypothetical protein